MYALVSKRPYLVRAYHAWISDCGLTPYCLVDATVAGVEVPAAYVQEGEILLNLAHAVCIGLDLTGNWIQCTLRFRTVPHAIKIPMKAVKAIYAKENGLGIRLDQFEEPDDPKPPSETPEGLPSTPQKPQQGPKDSQMRRAKVTIFK